MYVLIAFLTPILHALSCIVDAHFSNNIFKKVPSLVFYATISNIIIIPFLFLFGTPIIPPLEILAILFIISLIEVCYQIPYYHALRNIDTSIVVALFSLGKIAVPVLAYFIVNEKLNFTQYCGFGIILLSTFLLNFDIKKLKINIAFFLMLVVSLLLSLSSVLSKYSLQSVDFVTVLFWGSIFATSIFLSLLLLPQYRTDIVSTFPQYKKRIKLFLSNEILNQGGTLALTIALAYLPVLVVELIESSQSIFTLLLGFVLYKIFGNRFKENLTRQEVIKKHKLYNKIVPEVLRIIQGRKERYLPLKKKIYKFINS